MFDHGCQKMSEDSKNKQNSAQLNKLPINSKNLKEF